MAADNKTSLAHSISWGFLSPLHIRPRHLSMAISNAQCFLDIAFPVALKIAKYYWVHLFCLQLEASCLQWSFLLTVDNVCFFTYSWSFFTYSFSFFTYSWSFLLTVRKCV